MQRKVLNRSKKKEHRLRLGFNQKKKKIQKKSPDSEIKKKSDESKSEGAHICPEHFDVSFSPLDNSLTDFGVNVSQLDFGKCWRLFLQLLIQNGKIFLEPENLTKSLFCNLLHKQIETCNRLFLLVSLADENQFLEYRNILIMKTEPNLENSGRKNEEGASVDDKNIINMSELPDRLNTFTNMISSKFEINFQNKAPQKPISFDNLEEVQKSSDSNFENQHKRIPMEASFKNHNQPLNFLENVAFEYDELDHFGNRSQSHSFSFQENEREFFGHRKFDLSDKNDHLFRVMSNEQANSELFESASWQELNFEMSQDSKIQSRLSNLNKKKKSSDLEFRRNS